MELLNYINERLRDINISLADDSVREEDKAYLQGQKDELNAIYELVYEEKKYGCL